MDAGRHDEIGVARQRAHMVASCRLWRQCNHQGTAAGHVTRSREPIDDERVQRLRVGIGVCFEIHHVDVASHRGCCSGKLGFQCP